MKKLWSFLQSSTLEVFLADGWTGMTIYTALEFLETRTLLLEGNVWVREHLVAQGLLVLVNGLIATMLWRGKFSRKNQQTRQSGEEK